MMGSSGWIRLEVVLAGLKHSAIAMTVPETKKRNPLISNSYNYTVGAPQHTANAAALNQTMGLCQKAYGL
jgi:hypothetical protein